MKKFTSIKDGGPGTHKKKIKRHTYNTAYIEHGNRIKEANP